MVSYLTPFERGGLPEIIQSTLSAFARIGAAGLVCYIVELIFPVARYQVINAMPLISPHLPSRE